MSPSPPHPDLTRAWAEVDLGAIVHNFQVVRQRVGPECHTICAVKANAYGHGAAEVSRALVAAGADALAVACVAEAVQLRDAGLAAPIAVLSAALPDDAQAMAEHDLEPVLCTLEFAQALDAAAGRLGRRASVHVKVDTGMGRIGVAPEQAVDFIQRVAALPHVVVKGVCTHFAVAGDADRTFTHDQIARFSGALDALGRSGIDIPLRHAANSAGIIDMPDAHFNAVRPGIMLYGCYGSPHVSRAAGLREALTLKSWVTFVKDVPADTSLSYGRTFVTKRPSRIATLPIGYDDGYDRRLSNRGHALVRGQRVPIVGRVCMDQCLIDVTAVGGASVGDEAVLYGRQGRECIGIEATATAIGTIPHVLMCNLGRRIPRVYVRNG